MEAIEKILYYGCSTVPLFFLFHWHATHKFQIKMLGHWSCITTLFKATNPEHSTESYNHNASPTSSQSFSELSVK